MLLLLVRPSKSSGAAVVADVDTHDGVDGWKKQHYQSHIQFPEKIEVIQNTEAIEDLVIEIDNDKIEELQRESERNQLNLQMTNARLRDLEDNIKAIQANKDKAEELANRLYLMQLEHKFLESTRIELIRRLMDEELIFILLAS